MNVKDINNSILAFFIKQGLPDIQNKQHACYLFIISDLNNEKKQKFDKLMCEFVRVFGPIVDSLIHNIEQLEGEEKDDYIRVIEAIWFGDKRIQSEITSIFNI